MDKFIGKNPLFFAFFFPALTDGIITLLGQSPEYWTGSVANEASPAYYALVISPWLFALGSVFWFVFWYWVFKIIREPLNLFLMFVFIAGHSWGSSSWIWEIMKRSRVYTSDNQTSVIFAWSLVAAYFLLIALLATYCLRIYINERKR